MPTRRQPLLLSSLDKAGQVIRRKRLSLKVPKRGGLGKPGPMSTRDLETRLQTLESQDPNLYRAYSRSVQIQIEHEGAAYLTEKMSDARMLNALIEALWGGNVAAFEADTGVQLPGLSLLRQGVYAYDEGDPFTPTIRREPPHACEFMLRATSDDMAPLLVAGQWVGLLSPQARSDMLNQIVAVKHTTGLQLALAHPDGALTRGDTILDAAFKDVVGVATWVGQRPRSTPRP